MRRSERLKTKAQAPITRTCRKKHSQSAEKNAEIQTSSDWGKLDRFKRLKTKGRELDIMLSSTNGGENHGIHSEVISALSLPRAVQNQITNKKPNEDPKTIKLNLLDEEIAALVKFAYTGEVNVAQELLPSLLHTARSFRIKGLDKVENPIDPPPRVCRMYLETFLAFKKG